MSGIGAQSNQPEDEGRLEGSGDSMGKSLLDELRSFVKDAIRTTYNENIYKEEVHGKLVEWENRVNEIARKTGIDAAKVYEAVSDVQPIDVLNTSLQYWDKLLDYRNLPSEEQLVSDLKSKFGLDVKKTTKPFLPPDKTDVLESENDKEQSEKGEDVNRVAMALHVLLNTEIGGVPVRLNDLKVTVGAVPTETHRSRPYWIISSPKHQFVVMLNNQYGNRTFVLGLRDPRQIEDFAQQTKTQLKEMVGKGYLLHHFQYNDEQQFRGDLKNAVDAISDNKEMLTAYPTLDEAREALKKLGITKHDEYRAFYTDDARLPAAPDVTYKSEWKSWRHFLRGENKINHKVKDPYKTYEEASAAAQNLRFQSAEEYRVLYQYDPHLPSNPDKNYKGKFTDWASFLGTENIRVKDPYKTYEEAKAAVVRLKIKIHPEYRARYKEDKRLPSDPRKNYKDKWVSWPEFFREDASVTASTELKVGNDEKVKQDLSTEDLKSDSANSQDQSAA